MVGCPFSRTNRPHSTKGGSLNVASGPRRTSLHPGSFTDALSFVIANSAVVSTSELRETVNMTSSPSRTPPFISTARATSAFGVSPGISCFSLNGKPGLRVLRAPPACLPFGAFAFSRCACSLAPSAFVNGRNRVSIATSFPMRPGVRVPVPAAAAPACIPCTSARLPETSNCNVHPSVSPCST